MAKAKYAVVRTDNMSGTDVRARLVSLRYMGASGEEPTAIQNGSVVRLVELMDNERELYIAKDVVANDDINDVVLVATPELMYDERKRNLDEFVNDPGKNIRGYHFHEGDTFGVTKEALAGVEAPAVGDAVELANGVQLNVAKTATSGSTQVGVIHAIENAGRYTYYVVLVKGTDNASGSSAEPKPEPKPEPVQYSIPDQATEVLGGKKVSELIGDDIVIAADGKVTGTVHYVTGYTAFDASNEDLQKGNFFPIMFTCEGENMTIKRDGSVRKTCAFDKELIIHIEKQTSVYEVEVDSNPIVKLDFSTATLETEN